MYTNKSGQVNLFCNRRVSVVILEGGWSDGDI